MLCALSINKWNSPNKPECPFVLRFCLILTVLWKSYVFTILKYLLLFPRVKFNCVLFIALGINTHSLLRNFLQGLLNTRRWERTPRRVEGGYIKVQPCTAGDKLGPPNSGGQSPPGSHGPHPRRVSPSQTYQWRGAWSRFSSGLPTAGSIWRDGAELGRRVWGDPPPPAVFGGDGAVRTTKPLLGPGGRDTHEGSAPHAS